MTRLLSRLLRRMGLALLIAALALMAAGCRFAVVETGATRVAIPTATPAPEGVSAP